MTDCVIVQPIADAGILLLRQAGLSVHQAPEPDIEAMRPHLAKARAVITRNWGFNREAIEAAPHLQVIGSHGTGIDSIDLAAAESRSIVVVNTPGTNARSVAEHALGLMLTCAKQIPAADRALHDGNYAIRASCRPVELAGRTLGLVGYGRIARRLAGYARALGMDVHVLSEHSGAEALRADEVTPVGDLDGLCAVSDVISLHGLPAAQPLFDAARFARLRQGAILINTARGALIDEAALAAALRAGRLAGAALDVFREEPLSPESPLLGCPNLILTPHIGGTAVEAMERTAIAVAQKVLEALPESVRNG